MHHIIRSLPYIITLLVCVAIIVGHTFTINELILTVCTIGAASNIYQVRMFLSMNRMAAEINEAFRYIDTKITLQGIQHNLQDDIEEYEDGDDPVVKVFGQNGKEITEIPDEVKEVLRRMLNEESTPNKHR